MIWKRTNTLLSWSRSKTCLANEAGRAHDVIGHEVPHDPVLSVTLLDEWVFGIEREFEGFFFSVMEVMKVKVGWESRVEEEQ